MKRKKINYQLLLRRVCLIVLDIFLIILSSLMALATRFEFDVRQIPEEFFSVLLDYGVLMIFVTLIVLECFVYTAACGNTQVWRKPSRSLAQSSFLHSVTWQSLWEWENIFRGAIM